VLNIASFMDLLDLQIDGIPVGTSDLDMVEERYVNIF
jgi:hypothetical protein